jgi:hypothetical protein
MVVVVKELNANVKISQAKNPSFIPSIPSIQERRRGDAGFVLSIESSPLFLSFFFGGGHPRFLLPPFSLFPSSFFLFFLLREGFW